MPGNQPTDALRQGCSLGTLELAETRRLIAEERALLAESEALRVRAQLVQRDRVRLLEFAARRLGLSGEVHLDVETGRLSCREPPAGKGSQDDG